MSGATALADQPARKRKLAERVAERIVSDIIQRGWQAGDMLGTEADLIERYGISRATFREAVRQLEWHGAAGMRRGANGGLVVNAPPRLAAIFAIKAYFEFAGIGSDERKAASEVLSAAAPFRPGPHENLAIALFLEAADDRTVAALPEQRQAMGSASKLSERITLSLVEDIRSANAELGTVIGNEADLQQRFGISRAILREALRPLELHDILRVKAGSQGGVIVHRVDPEYTVGITSTYFTYTRIPLSQTWEANSSLSLASAEALLRQDDIPLDRLRSALEDLQLAGADDYINVAGEFHSIVANACGNRAIALFTGVLLRYFRDVVPRPDPRFLPDLKNGHRRLLDALETRDRRAAQIEIAAMFDHSRRWIRKVEAEAE
ncbi:MAG: GntR family transcriptional regulator [Sphingomonadaceae bacterium]|nr:GntR family transcriptional regulator [Sphingomonadaceae bacterium]